MLLLIKFEKCIIKQYYILMHWPWCLKQYCMENQHNKKNRRNKKTKSSPFEPVTRNMDASRIDTKKEITISYVCRDNHGKIHYCIGRPIIDSPILCSRSYSSSWGCPNGRLRRIYQMSSLRVIVWLICNELQAKLRHSIRLQTW